jgi:hypothetical protein
MQQFFLGSSGAYTTHVVHILTIKFIHSVTLQRNTSFSLGKLVPLLQK